MLRPRCPARAARRAAALVTALASGVALVGVGPAAATPPAPSSAATLALERAVALFDAREHAPVSIDARLATMYLRDLALRVPALAGPERERAVALLDRPSDAEPARFEDFDPEYGTRPVTIDCDATRPVCVHWVHGGRHAATDAFAATVLDVLRDVWDAEVVDAGYRPPKPDRETSPGDAVLPGTDDGGGPQTDVYLAELGDLGLFGYCASNDRKLATPLTTFDLSAYCVLDNDYLGYGYANPLLPLRVTAAHEFFHAVQFAYDAAEDAYLMEGTATWVEDEVFDAVNDNRAFLRSSPLSDPTIPLDLGTGQRVYGTWIWFRFLAERLGDPDVVRRIWELADAGPGGPDRYSTRATRRVLEDSGLDLSDALATFAAWNVRPGRFYEEGSAWPPARIQHRLRLTPRTTWWRVDARLRHLTSRAVSLARGAALSPDARLRIRIEGPPASTSPAARLVVIDRDGVRVLAIPLDAGGDGSRTVRFGTGVRRVVAIAVNASTRFRDCDRIGRYSCGGRPIDDDARFRITARVVD